MAESRTCSVGEIAELLNLTPRRVQQLVQEGVIPKAARGRYDLAGSIRAYVAHLQGQLGDGKAPQNLSAQRARLAAAQADKTEMELAARRRELVPLAEAVGLLQKVIAACRQRILAIPSTGAPLLRGKARGAPEVRQVLQVLTDEVLHELAAIDPADLGPDGGPATVEAPAQDDGERVGGGEPRPQPREQRRARKVAQ